MTNYEAARLVRTNSKRSSEAEGRKIIALLLDAGDAASLSADELELLCVGYNWAGESQKAYEASLIAVNKYPTDLRLLKQHQLWASNFLGDSEALIQDYKSLLRSGVGPQVLWYLALADVHVDLAYFTEDDEDWDWYEGMEIVSERDMSEAAKFIQLAINEEPSLLKEPSYIEGDVDWNTRYEPVIHLEKYAHLRREIGS